MADLIISKKETTPQSLTVTSASEKLTIEPTGSVIVELIGEYSGGNNSAYAVQSTASETASSNIITLNGPISITDVTTDPDESTNHYTYGLLVANTATTGTKEAPDDYTATIKTNGASTIDVTRETTSQKDVTVSGIGSKNSDTAGSYNAALLVFGDGNGTFQDAVTVSATNSNVDNGGNIIAYGISGDSSVITFNDELAAAINVTAIAKANAAKAYGINANTVTVTKGITKDITATATGAATADKSTNTFAYGICGNSTLTIGDKNTSADLAGTITAKATGNATLTGDKTKGYGGAAYAYGITASNSTLTIYGNVTKNITATATANKATQVDNGVKTDVSGWAVAYGISASNNAVSITGTLAGAIEATATAKTNLAAAIAITGNAVKIDNGITQDITATATGAATASENCDIDAYGIQAVCSKDATGIIIGTSDNKADLAGAITATATGSATLTGDGETGYAGNANAYAIYAYNNDYANGKVTINGNVTGDLSAAATANKVTTSDGTVVGGTAYAYGINASGAVSVGDVNAAIKATATAKANEAYAYGLYTSADSLTIGNITKDISATATGSANSASTGWLYANAYGIKGPGVTVGELAGAITVKATANAYLSADGTKATS